VRGNKIWRGHGASGHAIRERRRRPTAVVRMRDDVKKTTAGRLTTVEKKTQGSSLACVRSWIRHGVAGI
jgi:hypothetical protein